MLLRAYVGTQKIDEALQVMKKLEKVGGSDILQAYTQLGIELQEELKRLAAANDATRLARVRESFEKFLQQVYQSRDKSDYNSLLWIGETYYGLGQGAGTDPASAENYFARAGDAYNEIITGSLTNDANRNAVLLRLARCRRQQKKFEDGLKIVTDILSANPNALDAQFEAAHILTDWGIHGDAGAPRPEKFSESIQGIKGPDGKPIVWGWPLLARRLQQYSEKDPSPELKARFIEARYELSAGRRRFAQVHEPEADKQRASALAEITSFVQRYRDLDDVSFAKFDRLYQDLQVDRGGAPEPLQRVAAVEPATEAEKQEPAADATQKAAPAAQTAPQTAAAPADGGSGWLLPVIGVSLCIGVGAGMFFLMRKPKQRVRIPGSASAPKLSGIVPEAPTGGFNLPEDLSFDAPQIPDFTTLGSAVATRKPAPSSQTRPAKPATAGPVKRQGHDLPLRKIRPHDQPRRAAHLNPQPARYQVLPRRLDHDQSLRKVEHRHQAPFRDKRPTLPRRDLLREQIPLRSLPHHVLLLRAEQPRQIQHGRELLQNRRLQAILLVRVPAERLDLRSRVP